MFPIRRADGKLVGLVGRSYVGDRIKYLGDYLPFAQGDYLYGEHMLRGSQAIDRRLVVVEGQVDVIKVWMAGFDVVGILGGSCTTAQRKRLEVLGRDLVLMPDVGETGRKWSKRLGDQMKDLVNVYDVALPGPADPGELEEAVIRKYVSGAVLRF